MKFLDLNGLTHFFGKVKTWTGNNYLSLGGGLIRGNVTFYPNDPDPSRRIDIEEGEIIIKDTDINRYININDSTITSSDYDDTYLFGSGKMIPIGSANGVAGLDSNGYVPLSQLGNLDTTVAEVVTALPTTNIKKHIYLVKDASGVTQNQYEEYLYTGDTSATYDASKWEKLGDFRATVDLADYAKKSDAVKDISIVTYGSPFAENLKITKADGAIDYIPIPEVSNGNNGLMNITDKRKLDKLDTSKVTIASIDVSKIIKDISVIPDVDRVEIQILDINGNYKASAHIENATEDDAGVMSVEDKIKLNGISSGATADSAITTAEIDALFA